MRCIGKISFFLLLAALLLNSGCVYLRLLGVKRQCAQFEKYFEVNDKQGLYILFRKPVLYDQDVRWMGIESFQREKTENGEIWKVVLAKLHENAEDENRNFDITISFFFQNRKLQGIRVPESYLIVFPKEFIIFMLKTIGGGKVDLEKRTLTADSKTVTRESKSELQKIKIPQKSDVLKLLGKPYSAEDIQGVNVFTYRYRVKAFTSGNTESEKELYWAKLIFKKDSEQLLKVQANLFLLGTINLDYSGYHESEIEEGEDDKAHNNPR